MTCWPSCATGHDDPARRPDGGLALSVADRAYVLQSGTIRQSGTAATLRTDPAIVQAYLGKSPLPVAPLRRERGEG